MSKLIIFDKDSTLACSKSGAKFINRPDDQILIPGTAEMLDRLKADGSTIVVASNQGGVAMGHKTMSNAIDEAIYLQSLIPVFDYVLLAHSYETEGFGECIKINFTDGGLQWKVVTNSQQRFRKPNPGMIRFAKLLVAGAGNEIETVMIGDRPEDEQAAAAAGIPFRWVWDVNPMYPQELRGK